MKHFVVIPFSALLKSGRKEENRLCDCALRPKRFFRDGEAALSSHAPSFLPPACLWFAPRFEPHLNHFIYSAEEKERQGVGKRRRKGARFNRDYIKATFIHLL